MAVSPEDIALGIRRSVLLIYQTDETEDRVDPDVIARGIARFRHQWRRDYRRGVYDID